MKPLNAAGKGEIKTTASGTRAQMGSSTMGSVVGQSPVLPHPLEDIIWAKPGLRTWFGQNQVLEHPLGKARHSCGSLSSSPSAQNAFPPGELSCSPQHLWVPSVILREKWQKKNPTVFAEHFVGDSSEPGVSLSVPAPVHSPGGCPNISFLG